MCLLTVLPPGILPVREHLANGARLNNAGSGYVIVTGNGKLLYDRGLDSEDILRRFMLMRELYPEGWAVFHSRYPQTGEARKESCHPMIAAGLGYETLVAHNGYLFSTDDNRSDTQVFADDMLMRWNIDDAADIVELERIIGNNKVAILRAGKQPVILNKHLGLTLEDGTWHSNADYTGTPHIIRGKCSICQAPSETVVCASCEVQGEKTKAALLRVQPA